MGGTSPKVIYFRSIVPVLRSHKLFFCSTKFQKVGKLVGNYFCSSTVQKVCKPVRFYYCSTTVKKVGKLVGIYFCCTVYYGFYCNSTKVQHELVDYSKRPPSQILGEDALGRHILQCSTHFRFLILLDLKGVKFGFFSIVDFFQHLFGAPTNDC